MKRPKIHKYLHKDQQKPYYRIDFQLNGKWRALSCITKKELIKRYNSIIETGNYSKSTIAKPTAKVKKATISLIAPCKKIITFAYRSRCSENAYACSNYLKCLDLTQGWPGWRFLN